MASVSTGDYSQCCLIPPHDLLLNQKASAIPPDQICSPETQGLIEKMYDIAFGERTDRTKTFLVGLAAPQIGVLKRVILVDWAETGNKAIPGEEKPCKLCAFINPEILWKSEEMVVWREGCYSMPGTVNGIVPRSYAIRVRAYLANGELIEQDFQGYPARIFQHEIDHLDGIRFPDRLAHREHLHWIDDKDFFDYRQNWRSWKQTWAWDNWEKMKSGKPH
ncbi:MAG: peptide deformylase [Verrucomicrobia bacterium]|nr:peptide deformylase [Verrucomicrobiota bacterium]